MEPTKIHIPVAAIGNIVVGTESLHLCVASNAGVGVVVERRCSTPLEYRAALARIADAINQYLGATAPKVGDRVLVDGTAPGTVRRVDDDDDERLVYLDNCSWHWLGLDRLTKVPA